MAGRLFALFALASGLAACSVAPDDTKPVVNNPSWIAGTWSGWVTPTDKETQLSKGAEVYATFAADPNDKTDRPAGTFEFTFKDFKDTHVKGTFQSLGTTDVLLRPNDSNLSLLSQDQPIDLTYDIAGPGMTLKNDEMKLGLTRTTDAAPTGGTTPTTTGTPVTTSTSKIGGHWTCIDVSGRSWLLFIKSDVAFDVEIRQTGAATVLLSGAVTLVAGDDTKDADLTVTSSNLPSARGLVLYSKLQTDVNLQLTIKAGETMACQKDPNQ